jgi:hypothetical protein
MGSFQARRLTVLLVVISAMALLTNCEGQPPEDGTEVMRTALSGGSSTRVDLDFSQMKVFGAGEIEGECMTYEVDARIIERTRYQSGGSVQSDYLWVSIKRFCCDDDSIYSIWRGYVYLDADDYELDVSNNRREPWSASVAQTVTVRKHGDRSQTMDVAVDLNWAGSNIFEHMTRNRRELGGNVLMHFTQDRSAAEVSGTIELSGQPDVENVEFEWGSQHSVWLVNRSQTTHN